MTPASSTIKVHCNRCSGEKNHKTLHTERDDWSEDIGIPEAPGPIMHGFDDYKLVRCCGCDSISLRHESWCNDWGCDSAITSYPPERSRKLPKWLEGTAGIRFVLSETFVPKLLRQIYSAYHSKSYALAAMGIRALVEQVMVDKVTDKGSFVTNLKNFQEAGYLSKVQREFLEATLELGHAAIHRGYEPTEEDIRRSLDMTEPILETVYIHEGHASHLEKSVPKRKKAANKAQHIIPYKRLD
ncbi:MAG: DUF4145 domain-containing protein [Akkermansiaceae bacterium]